MSLARTAVLGLLAAAIAAPGAQAGIIFKFSPTNPKAGTKLAFVQPIRTQPVPSGIELPDGATRSVQLPEEAVEADLYLVRNSDVPSVSDRNDDRLIPLGHVSWAGSTLGCCPPNTSFPVPLKDVPPGNYAVAAWCADCVSQKFYVIGVGESLDGDAPLQLLRVPADGGIPYWPFFVALAVAACLVAASLWATRRKVDRTATMPPAKRWLRPMARLR